MTTHSRRFCCLRATSLIPKGLFYSSYSSHHYNNLSLSPLKIIHCHCRNHRYFSSSATQPNNSSIIDVKEEQSPQEGISFKIKLRPYQEECIKECLQAINNGTTRIGVSCPTGSGKTTIFSAILGRLPSRGVNANRVFVLVHTVELAQQAANSIKMTYPALRVEIDQGYANVASGEADVTVATYQTIHRPNRLQKLDPSKTKAVIVDEAHHSAAPSYLKILSHFDPDIRLEKENGNGNEVENDKESNVFKIPIIGFSATFSRADGLALGKVFDRIVFHKDFMEMIKSKWLCPVKFTTVNASIDLDEVKTNNGDFAQSSLASVVNTPEVTDLIIRTWLDQAQKRTSTLVFAVNVEHIRSLTDAFRQARVDARFLYAGTPRKERIALMESFRKQEFPVLVNCGILTEGADVPNIDCVLLARPTKSRNLFSQMIGRGMRLSPKTGKEDCLILDIVGNYTMGVVNSPSLFGLDPTIMIQQKSFEELERMKKEAEERKEKAKEAAWQQEKQELDEALNRELEIARESSAEYANLIDNNAKKFSKVAFEEFESVFELVEALKKRSKDDGIDERMAIWKISQNAWIRYNKGRYALDLLGKGLMTLDTDDDGTYKAFLTIRQSKEETDDKMPFSTNKDVPLFHGKQSLSDAIKTCDRQAKTYMDRVLGTSTGLSRWAPWRQGPASKAQITALRKYKLVKSVDHTSDTPKVEYIDIYNKKITLDKLTKGQAAQILTKRAVSKKNMPLWVKIKMAEKKK